MHGNETPQLSSKMVSPDFFKYCACLYFNNDLSQYLTAHKIFFLISHVVII